MKKKILLIPIIYVLFIIGTIFMLLIVYNIIDGSLALPFIIGYLALTLFIVSYMFIMTILNMRRLKWAELKKSIFKFFTLFFSLGVLNFGSDYFFRHLNIDLVREFSTSFGLAFAFSFVDIAFSKKKEEMEVYTKHLNLKK